MSTRRGRGGRRPSVSSGRTQLTYLVVHEAHVPGVQRCDPLAAVAGVQGSGQLLQRPLVVGVELVGQRQVQLLGAWLHGAVCGSGETGGARLYLLSARHPQVAAPQAWQREPSRADPPPLSLCPPLHRGFLGQARTPPTLCHCSEYPSQGAYRAQDVGRGGYGGVWGVRAYQLASWLLKQLANT